MQLHQIKPNSRRKKIKRVGRGGKRGTYSGRGQKGQRSRAGRRIKPAEREIIRRLPKLRGGKNKRRGPKILVLNVGQLEGRFGNDTINKALLFKTHFIKKISDPVKILGNGQVKRSVIVEGIVVSSSARKKIEMAGGRVT